MALFPPPPPCLYFEIIKAKYNTINIIKSNPDDFHNLSNKLIEKRNLDILDFKNITLIYLNILGKIIKNRPI